MACAGTHTVVEGTGENAVEAAGDEVGDEAGAGRTVSTACERFRAKTTRRSTANRARPAKAEEDR